MSFAGTGAVHEALSSWNSGSDVRPRWLHKTGDTAVQLYDYLQRTSDFPDALALCLGENPNARIVNLPASDLEITRQIGTADGLRSNLWLRGHNTRIFRDHQSAGASFSYLTWPFDGENVKLSGIHFEARNPPALFGALVVIPYTTNVEVTDCVFEVTPAPIAAFGTKLALLTSGSRRVRVMHNTFIRAQCAFAGVGHPCVDCEFSDNFGIDPNDVFCSAVSGVSVGMSVRNIKITDNIVQGVTGSAVFLVGSDGQGADCEVVSDVTVCNNSIVGNWQTGGFVNGPTGVRVFTGITTRNIKIHGNNMRADDDGARAATGIAISPCVSETTCEDISVIGNLVGRLGVDGNSGIHGIEISALGPNNVVVSGNTLRGNRGMVLSNLRDATIADNLAATELVLRATNRSMSGVYVHHSRFAAASPFSHGISLIGPNNITAEIDHCYFAGAGSAATASGGGSHSLRVKDCQFVGGIDASFSTTIALGQDNY